jgi:DNA-binding CsgD family transcriptional regulator
MISVNKKSILELTLTPRQEQILGLLSEGMSNQEIADELNIQHGTVKQHLFVLFRKLRVTNRAKAVIVASHLVKSGRATATPKGKIAPKVSDPASVRLSDYVWRMISVVSVFIPDIKLNSPEVIIRRDQYLIALREMVSKLTDALDGQFVSLPYGGMLIWFGHPSAHVDDADRAVQLAQLLQRWSDGYDQSDSVEHSDRAAIRPIGIGVASHPEVVAAKTAELSGAESFRMAAILARHARALGFPLADALTQKLAPLSVPWVEVAVSSDNPSVEQKRLGKVAAIGPVSAALPDIRARWGGMPFLDSIFSTVESGVSQWVSVESWPPAATTSLIDTIANASAARKFRVLKLRTPSINRRERLAACFIGQLESVAADFKLKQNQIYSYNTAGERLGAMIADCSYDAPLVVVVYGLKGLDAMSSVLGERGVDQLVNCPVLLVVGNLHDPGQTQTNIRLLGPRPAMMPFSRTFSMKAPAAESLSDDIRADLQALIDSLSDISRNILIAAASNPNQEIDSAVNALKLPHYQTQICLHELSSSGLVAPRPGGGFQFRDLTTAFAIKKLTIPLAGTGEV